MTERTAEFWPEDPRSLLEEMKARFKVCILKEEVFQLLLADLPEEDLVVEPFFADDTYGIEAHYTQDFKGERSGLLIAQTHTRRIPLWRLGENEASEAHEAFAETAKMLGYTPEEIQAVVARFEEVIDRLEHSVPPDFLDINVETKHWQVSANP
jgi:hypothetical protein